MEINTYSHCKLCDGILQKDSGYYLHIDWVIKILALRNIHVNIRTRMVAFSLVVLYSVCL